MGSISSSDIVNVYDSEYGQFTTEEPFWWYDTKANVNVGTDPIFFSNTLISGSNTGAMRIYQTLLLGHDYCPNDPGTINAEWSLDNIGSTT